MEEPKHFNRSVSCKDESLARNPHLTFQSSAITSATNGCGGDGQGRWDRIPWIQESPNAIFPTSDDIRNSVSQPSPQFCNLDCEHPPAYVGGDAHKAVDLKESSDSEKGKGEEQKQANRRSESPISMILLDQGLFTARRLGECSWTRSNAAVNDSLFPNPGTASALLVQRPLYEAVANPCAPRTKRKASPGLLGSALITERSGTMPRFTSCRGVSFEIKSPNASPFGVAPPPPDPGHHDPWDWLPWGHARSFKVFPISREMRRSLSQASSHFCDQDEGDEVEQGDDDIEKQKTTEEQQVPQQQQQANKRSTSVRGPKKKETRLSTILLDQGLFTVYKRLFVVSFALNMIALALAITGHFSYAKHRAALFSMRNILTLTLCRSEAFLRLIFWLAIRLLGRPWMPLSIKTATASFLQSVGGIHSGCGISSVAWLIYALVLTLNHPHNFSNEIRAVAFSILTLLCLSCIAAFPLVRHLHHNVFERTHRFTGWTALVLLWVFVVLTTGYNPSTKSYDHLKGSNLVKQQEFWLTVAITFLTVLPWVTVRRVPVSITAPSGHASIIKFAGGVEAGLLGRISRSPLSEWHAFGIISNGKDGHMMLAGAVGDFTKGLIADPPDHLWVRRVHFPGLPNLVNMYNRAVLVATGSGIGVFLSFLLQPCAAEVCLVWVTKGVEQNFGKEIKEMMSGHPVGKVIVHDTAVLGRPNVAEMTIEAAKNWKAEVVLVTSNPQGSRDIVRACKAAGIAAFAPIWDS